MADRKPLTQIASTAWEHPADRAALNTLRSIPGFDEVVRKVAGFFGERGVRQLFLANAVRVGPTQRPRLHALYGEVLQTLDAPDRWELYVSQTPVVNAMAVGFERPFIVINSGLLGLLTPDEQRDVLGHEVGHIMSGHATYTTIAIILMTFGLKNLPFLAGLALLPFELALFEWYRKAEFSADRAGLLATQELDASMRVFLKFAGGGAAEDEADLEAFMIQASEYETGGNAWDTVLKIFNTAFRTHPFATVRAAELKRWVDSGDYGRILDGQYPGRDGSQRPPLQEDYAEAAGYYGQQARQAVDSFAASLRRAGEAFNEAMKRK
jgi:Zn-dependent protease with chaperone function